jgi:Cu2+-containing amine oxidase
MDTVLIQLSSPGIMNLLKALEELKLIRVIKTESQSKTLLSEKYGGKLPVQVAAQLQQHINNSRSEWDNSI